MSYYWRRKKPSYEKVDLKMGSCQGWELASDLFQNKVGDAAGDEMEP
jgi:hypothetical protein